MRQRALTIGAGQGLRGRYGSGGLGRGCSVWVGLGDAAEGDFEAEGAELADVVGDLAAHVPLALVVVRAEVLISHTGVSQQRGAFSWVFPVATQALAVPRLRASRRWRAPSRVWVRPAATAVSPVMAPRYRLPFLALARPARLPDWWSWGARPAQETRCGPVRNLLMSTPVSATASWAARRPQPGIDSAWGSWLSRR